MVLVDKILDFVDEFFILSSKGQNYVFYDKWMKILKLFFLIFFSLIRVLFL